MRAFVLSIAVVLAATPLSGDIAWQTGRMAPGSVMVMAEQGGPVLSHVAQGRDGGLFRFDTYEGKGTAPVYHGSYYTNDRGEVVRSVTAEGQVTEYEPHRCARTLGTCSFVILHSDGFRETRRRVTRETVLGLAWTEWGLDGLVSSGALELDGLGVARTGWQRDHRSGRSTLSRRILMTLR
ncbi:MULTISPECIES: hypothetical protein [Salipiger]|uniref:Uncharacterized protein n=1 Tax=Salipiger bermudensis (strain DSM 26914 / JCM 13377 / KCTC 12554 / HTCC2601) TaxID=314265 RepID=Q0FQM4_SALBH|nr:hypothetical protein [Salipiger bermudensis]EAU46427.1 hypothetical protein R2601_15387 [Salipiger bermudensis HTCC2601]MAE88590.1 hypothetical protein [Pelagibaca sp.]MBR9890218.1 hypothetical protein [bacterium]MCA1285847.1 hypothetical protein [Salipiger bermudensis]